MKSAKHAWIFPGLLAAAAALSPAAHAVTYTAQVLTSGSSAQFGVFAEAAYQLAKADGGAAHFTAKTSSCATTCAALTDTRNGKLTTAAQGGTIWIVWSTVSGRVWAYTSVDSTVGVRLFEASPRATETLAALSSQPAAGANALAVWDDGSKDSALPSAVYAVVNGAKVNAANTDIRPEDALYATTHALTTVANGGLGYGTGTGTGCQSGTAIQSEVTAGTVAIPVSFALSGADPCSGTTVPAFTTIPVGAAPIVFVVNKSNTSGLGSSSVTSLTNTGSNDAFELFSGTSCNASLVGGSSSVPVNPILREPLSGTMNTTEFSTFEPAGSQEKGINPASSGNNPLDLKCTAGGGTRERAVGTGDVTKGVNALKDSIGYVFFSYEALVPASFPNLKYLKLNGVDPLATSASSTYTGALPTCGSGSTFSCPFSTPSSSYFNLRNGDYKAWSIYRMVTDTSGNDNTAVNALVTKAQTVVDTLLPDFVPFKAICGTSSAKDDPGLSVFREHYLSSGVSPNDGSLPANVTCTTGGSRTLKARTLGGGTEAGGDAGGTIVFTAAGSQPKVPGPTQSARP